MSTVETKRYIEENKNLILIACVVLEILRKPGILNKTFNTLYMWNDVV